MLLAHVAHDKILSKVEKNVVFEKKHVLLWHIKKILPHVAHEKLLLEVSIWYLNRYIAKEACMFFCSLNWWKYHPR